MEPRHADDGEFKRTLAWESRTLFERVRVCTRSTVQHPSSTNPDQSPTTDDDVESFLTEWRETAFDGEDATTLADRLAAAGVTEAQCRQAYATEQWPADVPLPGWVDVVEELTAAAGDHDGEVPPDLEDAPFVHAFVPWVEWAWSTLADERSFDRFSDTAVASVKQWLLQRFLSNASEPMYVRFQTYVGAREPTLLFGDEERTGDPPDDHYRAFVDEVNAPAELRAFFAEYPVLARFVATAVRQWRQAVVELHERLDTDWEVLCETFDPSGDPTQVRDLNVETSDRHHDGRSVVRISLSEDASVLYKPRSVETEQLLYTAYEDLSAAVSRPVDVPPCLSRTDYGWVGEIVHENCDSTAAVEEYYERAGVLLCLAYVLGLNDCHYENVLATSEAPVVVDAETVLHPRWGSTALDGALFESPSTVLDVGLLPGSFAKDEVEESSLCGFAPPEHTVDHVIPGHSKFWSHVNTDWMTQNEESQHFTADDMEMTNAPTVDGEYCDPAEFDTEIAAGFEAAYRHILSEPAFLDDLAARIEDLRTRFVCTPTESYALVLNALRDVDRLRDGRQLTPVLDTLIGDVEALSVDLEPFLSLCTAERRALTRLDVPRFEVDTTAETVYHDDTAVCDVVDVPGFEEFRERRAALGESDLAIQRDMIRLSLHPNASLPQVRYDGEYPDEPTVAGPDDATGASSSDDATGIARLDDERVETAVRELYQRTLDERRSVDGAATWLEVRGTEAETLRVTGTGNGIYRGRAGIGLFQATVAAVYDVDGAHEAALAALDPIRSALDEGRLRDEELGVAEGVGAAVYALAVTGDLLDEPELLTDAERAATRLTNDVIAADETYDVIGGSAGAVLALLALDDRRGSEEAVDRAIRCGEHLLEARVETDVGNRAWPSSQAEQPLTGFSHGASGIAYALYRLADRTGEDRFREAGREALAYERVLFSADEGNWPDRRNDPPTYMNAWCHGRAGCVHARTGIQSLTDDAPHLDTTVPDPPDSGTSERGPVATIDPAVVDRIAAESDRNAQQLCCGVAGQAAILLRTGRALDEPRYVERSHELLARVLDDASAVGTYLLPSHTSALYSPGLFMGTTGIGYALLTVADPETVPDLLRFE